MHDSNALTKPREQRIDDRFLVRQDGDDVLIHHRFTLLKFFFGFRSAEALSAFDSDRNRANRAPGDSLTRPRGTIFLPSAGAHASSLTTSMGHRRAQGAVPDAPRRCSAAVRRRVCV